MTKIIQSYFDRLSMTGWMFVTVFWEFVNGSNSKMALAKSSEIANNSYFRFQTI